MLIRSPMWKNVTKSGNMSKYAEDRSFWTWVKWSHWSSQAFPGPGSSAWFAKLRPRDDLKTGWTPDISWPPDHQTYQILIMTGWGDMQIHANPINIYKPVHKTGVSDGIIYILHTVIYYSCISCILLPWKSEITPIFPKNLSQIRMDSHIDQVGQFAHFGFATLQQLQLSCRHLFESREAFWQKNHLANAAWLGAIYGAVLSIIIVPWMISLRWLWVNIRYAPSKLHVSGSLLKTKMVKV